MQLLFIYIENNLIFLTHWRWWQDRNFINTQSSEIMMFLQTTTECIKSHIWTKSKQEKSFVILDLLINVCIWGYGQCNIQFGFKVLSFYLNCFQIVILQKINVSKIILLLFLLRASIYTYEY